MSIWRRRTCARISNLDVFHPQLRVERATQRGVMQVLEPLFPCYVFVRCVLDECLDEIQYANGVP